MKKKIAKIAALFASFVLVIVATVGVTLAYLSNKTEAVTNTFVAKSGLLQTAQTFTLDEAPVELSGDGNAYVKATGDRRQNNAYADLLAGMKLYKDPTVHLGKLAASAYMFVEIKETDFPAGNVLTYTVSGDWTKLNAVTGQQGGTVYVYSGAKATNNIIPVTPQAGEAVGDVAVLTNLGDAENKYHVQVGNFDAAVFNQTATLTVYGYLCQTAGFADAAAAYTACFPQP